MPALPPTLKPLASSKSSVKMRTSWFRSKVTPKLMVDFTRSFGVMMTARLPIVKALETARNQFKSSTIGSVIEEVLQHIRQGNSLAQSLKKTQQFSDLYIQMVEVGETSGTLDDILVRLAHFLEKSEALKKKIRSALAYPTLILGIATFALIFMLVVVVPTFAQMYLSFGAELPLPTQIVLRLSQFLKEETWWMGLLLVFLVFLLRYQFQSEKGKAFWDRTILRIPVIGKLIRESLVARFCQMLGTLLQSGVPLAEALRVMQRANTNVLVQEDLKSILQAVIQGKGLAKPIQHSAVFPEMVVQMLSVGEETAKLTEMLTHLALYYETQVDQSVQTLTAVIEPLLMVIVGIIVGFILISMYMPIFQLVDVIGQ